MGYKNKYNYIHQYVEAVATLNDSPILSNIALISSASSCVIFTDIFLCVTRRGQTEEGATAERTELSSPGSLEKKKQEVTLCYALQSLQRVHLGESLFRLPLKQNLRVTPHISSSTLPSPPALLITSATPFSASPFPKHVCLNQSE